MSDGSSLRISWYKALDSAETHFRQLVTSPSHEWKRVSNSDSGSTSSVRAGTSSSSIRAGAGRGGSGAASTIKGRPSASSSTSPNIPEPSDVQVHRKDDVYRLVLDVPVDDYPNNSNPLSLESWKAVLTTPELRVEWDPAVVEPPVMIEQFDAATSVVKTNYTMGWPANPRDAVTISRSFNDASTVINISTSLPRSEDEPVYLRPAPPYVRSHVGLFAWCIQQATLMPKDTTIAKEESDVVRKPNLTLSTSRQRITCFWQHDLKAMFSTSSTAMAQQLATMLVGLLKTVVNRGMRVPKVVGWGDGIVIERMRWQDDREALTVAYAIVPEEQEHQKEQRRLARAIECILPGKESGWDVLVSTQASSAQTEALPWTAHAIHGSGILLRISHAPLLDDHDILKVKVTIEISGSRGLRLNGIPQQIHEPEESRSPVGMGPTGTAILQDVASIATDASSMNTGISSMTTAIPTAATFPTRSAAAAKSILSRVKRNYIYFSSLLQEPEAKWKRTTEARGVTITQLDSIDPTLVVYRAEAAFVGVTLWDLYSAVVSPGARFHWDKQHEDAVLLEHVNELTELWHFKTRAAWPVVGRDSVVLKTVYKSPTAIHVFAFSADEASLFPNIPDPDSNVIRTQVDLQGWAIEALSPNTTMLTLLEQSDPKGWTNKTSIPTLMINSLAGIGEFVIKSGGPPVLTRLSGARANDLRYDHERSSFRVEYLAERQDDSKETGPEVECEIRCDVDTWASSLDIVVDPPPQSTTCLRRHKLSEQGGGLWVTIVHDAVLVDQERLLVIVRRGPGRERGVVMVNGAKITVDQEEIPDSELKSLVRRKRVKPTRIPLDQPPVISVVRRRRAEWHEDHVPQKSNSWVPRFLSYAIDQTQNAVAAITPGTGSVPPVSKSPMQYALEALGWIQDARDSTTGWTNINEKGLSASYRTFEQFPLPVYRGEKVIQGVSAEELASLVHDYDCRKQWDPTFSGASVLESFGSLAKTAFVVEKAQFPFRDRGFFVASVIARAKSSRRSTSNMDLESRNAVYCVSVSFNPDSVAQFDKTRYNRYDLPIGRVFVDGWVLETLDPYDTKENYAVPSTRCLRMVSVDFAGSMPKTVGEILNMGLVRGIGELESWVKSIQPVPITRLPPAGFAVNTLTVEQQQPEIWKVRKRDQVRTLVDTRFEPETRIYTTTILVHFAGTTPVSPVTTPRPVSPSTTPRPSMLMVSPASPPFSPTPPNSSELTPSFSRERSDSSPIRERTLSATSLSPRERTLSSTLRGRASAFNLNGQPRPPTDLLVAELVIDSKMYPSGYSAILKSKMGPRGSPVRMDSQFDPSSVKMDSDPCPLPLVHSIHTMPLSPMHSSGVNATTPTRHLLRLTLPTAQYEISTILDPLTGEIQHAPAKPAWLVDMEEGEAVVQVQIRPNSSGTNTILVQRGNDQAKQIEIVGEKESLTALGRDELSDDRFNKMTVVSRTTNQSATEAIPEELKLPVGVADTLLDRSIAVAVPAPDKQTLSVTENDIPVDGEKAVETKVASAEPPEPSTPSSGRILGFLHSYPLARFGSSGSSPGSGSNGNLKVPGGLGDLDAERDTIRAGPRHYSRSETIFIALIAFLIGSLLRSLLSPADFIYVVTDLQNAKDVDVNSWSNGNGWREIRRLFEMKYIAGGWDFQIAIVRRH
ncbi:hypothetical protein C8J56DRAFT_949719 [Mycena floridula]|nr:hypothetical protein C8J56DRAFT_949719 [Mycena floridula]